MLALNKVAVVKSSTRSNELILYTSWPPKPQSKKSFISHFRPPFRRTKKDKLLVRCSDVWISAFEKVTNFHFFQIFQKRAKEAASVGAGEV